MVDGRLCWGIGGAWPMDAGWRRQMRVFVAAARAWHFPPLAGAPWTGAVPLFELAEYPNLHCKVTSNVIELAGGNEGDPRAFIALLVRHFGASRVMWGSDFCQTHDRTYAELVALARDAFGGLSPEQQRECLGGTAARLWPTLG